MDFLTKEQLLAAASSKQRPCEIVEVPELGHAGRLVVQGMSGIERDAWETSLVIVRGKHSRINTENIRASLAVRSIVDQPGGTRLFADGDAAALGQLRGDTLNKIFEAAQRVNGVSDSDVSELKKSSEQGAGTGSPTS